uniref:Odorant receptor n=1 Tax=Tetraodon nigroviridis TaxID=99883 RepID=Q2PR81_TETNG|nr:odorant receptor [Tetraodon nigroviridis]
MNLSQTNGTAGGSARRDSLLTALLKNLMVTCLCLLINYVNGVQIHTFRKHQVFYSNPRYVLFIHLVVNDMLQVSLSSLLHVLSYVFLTVSASFCAVALLATMLTTQNTPLNLAAMAVERYLAVCLPLRYAHICTLRRTYRLVGAMWAAGLLAVLPDLFFLAATRPRRFFGSRLVCSMEVFGEARGAMRKDAWHAAFLVLVWLTLLYTYVSIGCAARRASAQAQKARNTILLHAFQLLLSMLSYVRGPFEQALLRLLPRRYLAIVFASFILIQVLPRLVSPVVYGLRDQSFRKYVGRYLLCRRSPA